MSAREFPHVPTDLLKKLEELYPLRMPALEEPERSIWMRTGERKVIDLLRHHHERQNSALNVIQG